MDSIIKIDISLNRLHFERFEPLNFEVFDLYVQLVDDFLDSI